MSETWHVTFFGSLEVSNGDAPLRFATRKAAALFAFLAYHPGRSFSRDHLVTLFWPDDDVERARNSLRVALSGLKKGLEALGGGDLLRADRIYLSVAADGLETDVARFHASLRGEQEADSPEARRGHLSAAIALYRGPLLSDWYEDWITPERERLSEAYAAALRRLASLLMDGGSVAEALEAARRSVAAEPLREEGHRFLIELYRRAGQRDAALRQYRDLERLLREELGIAPSRETHGLMTRVHAETGVAAPPASETLPSHPPPSPATAFFGRDAELVALTSLLFREGAAGQPEIHAGLVCVVGLPGVGKSRMVSEALARVGLTAPGARLWHLSLDGASADSEIGAAFARLLSAPVADAEASGAALARRLGPEAGVLFLDDVDAEPDAVAPFLRSIQRHLPRLLVVVTALQPPGLAGARVLTLSPLPVPDPEEDGAYSENGACVRLFEDRARAANPDFRPGAQGMRAVAEVCRQVGGVPAALKAAASWAGLMTPEEMAQRLDRDPVGFLVHQRADCPPRHRAPGARLQSYCNALPDGAGAFLRGLVVFRGGWTLADAEYVTGESRSLALLTALQRRAVVSARGEGETVRFSLGELARRCVLAALPDPARRDYERRHAERFAGFAERFGERVNSREGAEAVCRLRAERENLAAALENCLGGLNESALALRIAAALWRFWYAENAVESGNAVLERAVTAAGAEVPWEVRCRALEGLGRFALHMGHLTRAVGVFQDALDAARSHGDTSERLTTLATGLQVAACARGDLTRTREVSKLLLALKTRERDLWAVAAIRTELARAYAESGEGDVAHAEEARKILRDLDFEFRGDDDAEGNLGYSFLRVGHLAVEQGDYAASLPLLHDAARAFRVAGNNGGMAVALERLGMAQARMGYADAARDALEEALALRLSGTGRAGEAFTRRLLARVVRAANDHFTLHTLLTESQQVGPDGLPDAPAALERGNP